MNLHPADIELAIWSMAGAVSVYARGFEADSDPSSEWWVLLCGGGLERGSFAEREKIRDSLLREMTARHIHLVENQWVWDETDMAHLVVARFVERGKANACCRALVNVGLRARVVPGWSDSEE